MSIARAPLAPYLHERLRIPRTVEYDGLLQFFHFLPHLTIQQSQRVQNYSPNEMSDHKFTTPEGNYTDLDEQQLAMQFSHSSIAAFLVNDEDDDDRLLRPYYAT
jgi:hypothetical protein